MSVFIGFVSLGGSLKANVLTRDSSGTPTQATAGPTYRVYGSSGIMANGTGSAAQANTSTNITGATNATPIVITSAAHGLSTGTRVTITGVGGNTAANTTAQVTRIDANTFSLDSVAGNGAYTSGGIWNVTGLYSATISCIGGDGYASGENYILLWTFTVSVVRGDIDTFGVV